ncbi:MAG: DUF86 domain-containing protein [Chromatiales bacterium]|nr:DUF86 domain-containing protein [Chromatiales bacterium]
MSKNRSIYIRHIHDLIGRIEAYTADGEQAFKNDTKTQDAVLHNLEIIGQCVRDYGIDALARDYPATPWAQIDAFRNVLAHKYLGADIDLVWEIVDRDLPGLVADVRRVAEAMALDLDT